MPDLKSLLAETARRHHDHLCPRQVLGVRMGLYAADLLQLELPRADKRLFAFVETDGCVTDGIAVATGCWWGSRTMYLIDYGKVAATFVDTSTAHAIRIWPARESRACASVYAPAAPDRWHAQLEAYQIMPIAELFRACSVKLTVSLGEILSHQGDRKICDRCGEDIINERQVQVGEQTLCRSCAGTPYYCPVSEPTPSALEKTKAGGTRKILP